MIVYLFVQALTMASWSWALPQVEPCSNPIWSQTQYCARCCQFNEGTKALLKTECELNPNSDPSTCSTLRVSLRQGYYFSFACAGKLGSKQDQNEAQLFCKDYGVPADQRDRDYLQKVTAARPHFFKAATQPEIAKKLNAAQSAAIGIESADSSLLPVNGVEPWSVVRWDWNTLQWVGLVAKKGGRSSPPSGATQASPPSTLDWLKQLEMTCNQRYENLFYSSWKKEAPDFAAFVEKYHLVQSGLLGDATTSEISLAFDECFKADPFLSQSIGSQNRFGETHFVASFLSNPYSTNNPLNLIYQHKTLQGLAQKLDHPNSSESNSNKSCLNLVALYKQNSRGVPDFTNPAILESIQSEYYSINFKTRTRLEGVNATQFEPFCREMLISAPTEVIQTELLEHFGKELEKLQDVILSGISNRDPGPEIEPPSPIFNAFAPIPFLYSTLSELKIAANSIADSNLTLNEIHTQCQDTLLKRRRAFSADRVEVTPQQPLDPAEQLNRLNQARLDLETATKRLQNYLPGFVATSFSYSALINWDLNLSERTGLSSLFLANPVAKIRSCTEAVEHCRDYALGGGLQNLDKKIIQLFLDRIQPLIQMIEDRAKINLVTCQALANDWAKYTNAAREKLIPASGTPEPANGDDKKSTAETAK